jgi:hypothetical protein
LEINLDMRGSETVTARFFKEISSNIWKMVIFFMIFH